MFDRLQKTRLNNERLKAIEKAQLIEEKRKQEILSRRKGDLDQLRSKEKNKDTKHKFVFSVALIKLLVLAVCGVALYLAFRYYF